MRDITELEQCSACGKRYYAHSFNRCDCTNEQIEAALKPKQYSNRAERRAAEKSKLIRLRQENAALRKRLSRSAQS